MRDEFLQVEGLSKVYPARRGGAEHVVFRDLNFGFGRGEFVCVLGHSGCGKSTLLNILAGLDEPTSGAVIMDGREVRGPSLDRGVVFQGHALLPWLTVLGNVEFAVASRYPELSRSARREHCQRYIEMVGLAGNEHKRPAELSGGMKQRVGIARAFAIQPKMLLLDEPFGALDALTRGMIQDELMAICAATRQTVFMITHDIDEAILLADKIFLMTNGPNARLAEVVANTLPRPRDRREIHRQPAYYPIRNHLVDFLLLRSREAASQPPGGRPPVVYPGQAAEPAAPGSAPPRVPALDTLG